MCAAEILILPKNTHSVVCRSDVLSVRQCDISLLLLPATEHCQPNHNLTGLGEL